MFSSKYFLVFHVYCLVFRSISWNLQVFVDISRYFLKFFGISWDFLMKMYTYMYFLMSYPSGNSTTTKNLPSQKYFRVAQKDPTKWTRNWQKNNINFFFIILKAFCIFYSLIFLSIIFIISQFFIYLFIYFNNDNKNRI
jgi:hypothetical protein